MFRRFGPIVLACLVVSPGLEAQSRVDSGVLDVTTIVTGEELEELGLTNSVGDILSLPTPSTARVHVYGNGAVRTADYFRGVYDGDPEEIDQVDFTGGLSGVMELIRNREGLIKTLNLVAGFQNSIGDRPDEVFTDALWYEDDQYASLVSRLPYDMTGAFTYSVYNSPTGELNNSEELSLAFSYAGRNLFGNLHPQIKVATRTRGFNTDGIFLQGSMTPTFKPFADCDMMLEIPVVFGVGFDNYYFVEANRPVYGSIGAIGVWPLDWIDEEFGDWSLSAGAELLVRETSLVDLGPFYDDADNAVVTGLFGVRFVY